MTKNTKALWLPGLLLACLLALTVLFSACRGDGEPADTGTGPATSGQGQTPAVPDAASIQVFDGTQYTAKIIYSTETDADITTLRGTLSKQMKDLFGAAPEMAKDTDSAADSSVVEILLGQTNRPESALPGAGEHDAWVYVGIRGNKLVINGSNAYMLEQAVNHFLTECLPTEGGAYSFEAASNYQTLRADWQAEGWLLNELPYYAGQNPRYATSVYDAGRMLTNLGGSASESAKLMMISQTSQDEFNAYVEKLKGIGYTEVARDTLEGGKNEYVTLTDGTNQVYTYFTSSRRLVNVIVDNASATAAEISVANPGTPGEGVEIYQYGLNMDPADYDWSGVSGYSNNGMLYIIKCADNSLILVDGGDELQMLGTEGGDDAPMAQLNDFLHEITDTAEGERVTIACWFLTHAHGDHMNGFAEFLGAYHEQYDLRAVCANLPYGLIENVNGTLGGISGVITANYPDCKEIKIHTGQKLEFAGVSMQALYTHEDSLVVTNGLSQLRDKDFNNTSTVMKVTAGDMTMLILGDSFTYVEDYLLKAYTKDTLACDIIQVAHHAFNQMDALYRTVQAKVALFPQSYGVFQHRVEAWEITAKNSIEKYIYEYADPDMIFFAGKAEKTVGLALVDGEIQVILTPEPVPEISGGTVSVGEDDDPTEWGELHPV